MNYRSLLKKYMADIVVEEGTDFVNGLISWGYTEEEIRVLQKISAELTAEEKAQLIGVTFLDILNYFKITEFKYKPNAQKEASRRY